MDNSFERIKAWAGSHKLLAFIIIAGLAVGGYFLYQYIKNNLPASTSSTTSGDDTGTTTDTGDASAAPVIPLTLPSPSTSGGEVTTNQSGLGLNGQPSMYQPAATQGVLPAITAAPAAYPVAGSADVSHNLANYPQGYGIGSSEPYNGSVGGALSPNMQYAIQVQQSQAVAGPQLQTNAASSKQVVPAASSGYNSSSIGENPSGVGGRGSRGG